MYQIINDKKYYTALTEINCARKHGGKPFKHKRCDTRLCT